MNVRFVKCTESDVSQLSEIGIETYSDTFAAMNSSSTMAAYLRSAFSVKRLRQEIQNKNSAFLFLYYQGKLAGYLKVNEKGAQSDLREETGLEIERVYVRKGFQGRGLGKILIEKGISIAKRKRKTYVWLGVWDRNESAIGFYERMGFKRSGTHEFQMGDERQIDYVMKKHLILLNDYEEGSRGVGFHLCGMRRE